MGYSEEIGYRSIIFHRTNNTEFAITMEKDMTLNIEDKNVVLTCTKGSIWVPITNIKCWSYSTNEGDNSKWSDSETGINNSKENKVNIIITENKVSLQNLSNNSNIGLISINGQVIFNSKVSGNHEIDLEGLSCGVYVLTYNNNSLKFVIK